MSPKLHPLLGCFDFYYFKEGNLTRFQGRKSVYIINYLQTYLTLRYRFLWCRRGETDVHPLFQHHPVNPVTYWYEIKITIFPFLRIRVNIPKILQKIPSIWFFGNVFGNVFSQTNVYILHHSQTFSITQFGQPPRNSPFLVNYPF